MIDLLEFSYLNDVCFLSLNTDDKKYRMCLKMAQDDLYDILGGEFYDQIETQVDYGGTLSADNETLYEDYIKDFLAWLTYYHYLTFANVEATPTGIREFDDENSTVASDVKMWSLEKKVYARANSYKGKMINFLKLAQSKDSTKYPLWSNSCITYNSFSITSISKTKDETIKINRTINNNE